MSGEQIYSMEVSIVRCPGDGEDGGPLGTSIEKPTMVRYCDVCRRWGAVGSTHICWRNWQVRLSDLLLDLSLGGWR